MALSKLTDLELSLDFVELAVGSLMFVDGVCAPKDGELALALEVGRTWGWNLGFC